MPANEEFVEQFELLLQEVEQVIREYPPEMRDALRDEARIALRTALQQRWEAGLHRREEGGPSRPYPPNG
jgi:hypothetical protein